MTALDTPHDPTFPPLMSGEATRDDPLERAILRAEAGCDAGLVTYRIAPNTVSAALVFAPEVPLCRAVAMLPLCGVGLQNALGALAPPEVALHLDWRGAVSVNLAECGRLRMAASGSDADAVPEWLIVAFTLARDTDSDRPGDTPEQTTLAAEGCGAIDPALLVEAWARHTLAWIARWEDEGNRPLHAEWRGLAQGIGETVTVQGRTGTFLGVDDNFGMLLRDDAGATALIPLTTILEQTP